MNTAINSWLVSQQVILDKIIANAAKDFFERYKSAPNFKYDLQKCHRESYNLINGIDLCYDRPNTAFAYSLWYHPRRINTFLSYFLDAIINHQRQKLDVFDLGAGTGAIQWALGLIYCGLKRQNIPPPKITIVNIDVSPFMLYYSRDFLWPHFIKEYPEIDGDFIVEYEVNSWGNEKNLKIANPVIAASYLFDASDNRSEIADDFVRLIENSSPAAVLLIASTQPDKLKLLHLLKEKIMVLGYQYRSVEGAKLIFSGATNEINTFRSDLNRLYDITELKRPASWSDQSHTGMILQKTQEELVFELNEDRIPYLRLFTPPVTIRKDILLNEKQVKASIVESAPSVIVGPAGCGKSIVITEKIRNIISTHGYAKEIKILVTTFNKELLGKLAEWIADLLDSVQFRLVYDSGYNGPEKSCSFYFKDAATANIRLLHFDMLPKKLGSVTYKGLVNHNRHFELLNTIISEVKQENNISGDQYNNILDCRFLYEEYHRVIYGLQVGILNGEDSYLAVKRKGRGNKPSMPKNSDRRKIAWQCLVRYAKRIHSENIQSFTLRRQYFYAKLRSGEIKPGYDFILVDEFQDCTDADFEIFYMMIKDPNNITIAGDLAQSIQLGTVARIPRDARMERRQFHRLEGSYRLPVRISECIRKFSEAIVKRYANDEGVTGIIPFKGAPPGSRPIVVYAPEIDSLAEKISHIFSTYSIYDIKTLTILEKDNDLKNSLLAKRLNSETDSVLRLKGLEKECVLWATWVPFEFEKEAFEFAYTVVSRTSCILIIALLKTLPPGHSNIFGLLNKQRIIFWDRDSEIKFTEYCTESDTETVIDED